MGAAVTGRAVGGRVAVAPPGSNFLFFAGTTLSAFPFAQPLLPETKGRSPEEAEQDLLRGRPARPEAERSVPVSSGAARH
ncbi:hypothetical protein [Streptomyces sp. NPDC015125]|uniref:hypothetical protein n=1 Tax=Streptomyces sp. NPDC015125 TaxID=3364938 RepID=UPI0036FD6EB0